MRSLIHGCLFTTASFSLSHFYRRRSDPVLDYRCLWGRAEDDHFQDKCSQQGRPEDWKSAPGSGSPEDRVCILPVLKTPGTSLVQTFKHWWYTPEDNICNVIPFIAFAYHEDMVYSHVCLCLQSRFGKSRLDRVRVRYFLQHSNDPQDRCLQTYLILEWKTVILPGSKNLGKALYIKHLQR